MTRVQDAAMAAIVEHGSLELRQDGLWHTADDSEKFSSVTIYSLKKLGWVILTGGWLQRGRKALWKREQEKLNHAHA